MPRPPFSKTALAALPGQLPNGGYDLSIEWLLDPTRPRENIYTEADSERLQREVEEEKTLTSLELMSKGRQKELEGLWKRWEDYASRVKIQPEQPWIDICTGNIDWAKRHFQLWLREYVANSIKLRPCLGPDEYEPVQTITCASTLDDVWSDLVCIADIKVLEPRRQLDPSGPFHKINYSSRHPQNQNATVVGIGKWIARSAEELNLQLEQTFEKRAISTEDLLLILDTLWIEAVHIPCLPKIRLGFHTAVVLGGAGGWRPASLLGLTYRDVEIALMRHPKDWSKISLVARIRIHHVKQKEDEIKRDQRHKLEFDITFVPQKPICLLTLFLARAFEDEAFYSEYRTIDELLSQPLAETARYRPFKWKPKFTELEKGASIIPIGYHQFRDIWNRVLCVMGMPENPRIYGLRVGTARKLDGQLTPALRNFIINQSTDVFERSYQTMNVPLDLMKLSYGQHADGNEELLQAMQGVCYKRDRNAPIYIKKQDLEDFYKRRDITLLKEAQSRGDPKKKIAGRIQHIINTLEGLLLEKIRHEYFEAVKEGKPTTDLIDPSRVCPRKKQNKTSSIVAGNLVPFFRDGVPAGTFLERLVAYLKGLPSEDTPPRQKPRCLLCSSPEFHGRPTLTRHVLNAHMEDFQRGFSCPECHRLGLGRVWIGVGQAAWSSHVAQTHGELHAPKPTSAKSYVQYILHNIHPPFNLRANRIILGKTHRTIFGLSRFFLVWDLDEDTEGGVEYSSYWHPAFRTRQDGILSSAVPIA
ncbi:FluG domain-containing protein [Fusarium austroafricanum]|uniref:FluG domain-containing protein n=1 Tax=Fusarium austroafricanum TaxID=2364996 RepID=A0A8H4NWP5_9HYPO|nr:FluG domain-containing protein [Fusarium austroafricanum]